MKSNFRRMWWSFGLLVLGLQGCITVKTTVRPNGSVVRRYEVVVRPVHQEMARQELQSYLGKGWKKPRLREISIDKTEISAERRFRNAQELPYVRAQVHGPQPVGWLHLKHRYVYEETLSMGIFLPTDRERQVVQNFPAAIYQLTMPGVIQKSGLGARPAESKEAAGQPSAPESPPSSVAGAGPSSSALLSPELENILTSGQPGERDPKTPNTVSWSLSLGEMEGHTLVAVSERWNYARLVSLVFGLLVVLGAAAYILSPLWRWIGRKLKERAAVSPEERERRKQEKEEKRLQQAQERAAREEERERRRREQAEKKLHQPQRRRWRWPKASPPPAEEPAAPEAAASSGEEPPPAPKVEEERGP